MGQAEVNVIHSAFETFDEPRRVAHSIPATLQDADGSY